MWDDHGIMNKRATGSRYEDTAAAFLVKKGYKILHRNYRVRGGELDIVASFKETLVICEVKYRSTGDYGDALEAVDHRKQLQISKVTMHYMNQFRYPPDTQVRFDVIGVTGNGITHIENAFLYCYR